ncbi:DNA polymerase IV [Chitinophaga sancti]|uniref:DNA polymerase IV n=1 Tax=Chitinophaga sancti TaxID=1004 RepID=A0A1K1PGW5_9BACT|nr:DNA polymerase IV [Chitinophaga sancti]WQD65889.1 DNA polymerase IV [Chitinophaga sancti]WQG88489.1 DNA polymerase IV [Chitinophaga sancti]SFW46685.1 DNA polymerase-4 [Chitinophaga sancti]
MEQEANKKRKIIHIDMDAFYASVEQRDFPEYRGKPVIVGGPPNSRGVVATASYEARKFGVRSAMSSRRAVQLCPEGIFVYPRFDVYKEVSRHIREIFDRYTDLIEPLSLDEAYLDVSVDKLGIGSAIEIAKLIKQAIKDELRLTASAGVSINKFVAKIASDMNKPDGLTFIGPSQITTFMEQLPVEKFHGVGKVTAEKMKKMGLHTGGDLKRLSENEMKQYFGKPGGFYYRIVRGIDEREVQPHRETKSAGAEDTFPVDLTEAEEMNRELERIGGLVTTRLKRHNLKGRTITLKIKYSDFKQITRNQSLSFATDDLEVIVRTAKQLLAAVDHEDKAIRLLGISLSNFGELITIHGSSTQLSLFD